MSLLIANTIFTAQPEETKTGLLYFKYFSTAKALKVPTQGCLSDLKNIAKAIVPEHLQNDIMLILPGGGEYNKDYTFVRQDNETYRLRDIHKHGQFIRVILTQEGLTKYNLHKEQNQPKTS